MSEALAEQLASAAPSSELSRDVIVAIAEIYKGLRSGKEPEDFEGGNNGRGNCCFELPEGYHLECELPKAEGLCIMLRLVKLYK